MESVIVEGADIRWREAGRGDGRSPVVLIHGAAGSSLLWLAQVRALSSVAHVIAIDLPGHGHSGGEGLRTIGAMREFLVRFIDVADLSRVVLVGHSMGGAVALDTALVHPDRIASVVLVSTGAKLAISPAIIAAIENEWHAFPRLMRDVAFGPDSDADLRTRVSDLMLATRREVALADFLACNDFDLRERLVEIDVPARVICGDADLLTPMKYSEYLATKLPRATLDRVERAGHMLPVEAPGAVSAAIRGFVESLGGPPGYRPSAG